MNDMMSSLHFYFNPTFNTHVMRKVFVFIKSGCKYSRSLLPILSCLLFLLPPLISGQFPFMGKGEEKLPIGFRTLSTEDRLVSVWTSLWRGSLPSWLRDQAPPRRSCNGRIKLLEMPPFLGDVIPSSRGLCSFWANSKLPCVFRKISRVQISLKD